MTDNGGAYANVVNIRQLTNDGFSVVLRILSDVFRCFIHVLRCFQKFSGCFHVFEDDQIGQTCGGVFK